MNYLQGLSDVQLFGLEENYPVFLESTKTITARGTFYNTRAELEKAMVQTYRNIFSVDRLIFGLTFLLPGSTDYAKQIAVYTLLSNRIEPANENIAHLLPSTDPVSPEYTLEENLIKYLLSELKPQKVFNLFETLRRERVNNSRTTKTILRFILPRLNPVWAVRYRRKLRRALEHAYGKKTTTVLLNALSKIPSKRNNKDRNVIRDCLEKYLSVESDWRKTEECLRFVLGNEERLRLSTLKAYVGAKDDISAGLGLPYETLEGIRSTYHKGIEKGVVLGLTKDALSTGQRKNFQRKAKTEQVEVVWNPYHASLVDLFLYGFEQGFNGDVNTAIEEKARLVAEALPPYPSVSIIIDTSESMKGHSTQKYRPYAIALALREILSNTAENEYYIHDKECSLKFGRSGIYVPEGDTELASLLLEAFNCNPSIIYVISDGYENAPAGRFNEVLNAARKVDITTPVFHINPVAAAEVKGGSRQLSDEAPTLTCTKPETLPTASVDALLKTDVLLGINMLIGRVVHLIEG